MKLYGEIILKFASVSTAGALMGLKQTVQRSSKLPLGGRLVTAIPAGLTAFALFGVVVPLALLVDRIVKPILKSSNTLRQENGEKFSHKHKVASWALMPLKLVATVPVTALAAVIMAVASPILIPIFIIGIATGSTYFKNFMNTE
ncbi:MAG: hypothetical protein ACK5MA_03160 [Parachlamydiaceae bacterium]